MIKMLITLGRIFFNLSCDVSDVRSLQWMDRPLLAVSRLCYLLASLPRV
jgi:hypothetical protein